METRIPVQKRSIEKREKIIKDGFSLMCTNGYYKTSAADIAKYAQVSTGIIYQYFNDKKDIFLEGVKDYSKQIMFPIIDILNNEDISLDSIDSLLRKIIDKLIENHNLSEKEHEEIMAMAHLDSDVGKIFKENELAATKQIWNKLQSQGIILENPLEKIHIILNLVDQLCHEMAYHKHTEINYEIMKDEVIKLILSILK